MQKNNEPSIDKLVKEYLARFPYTYRVPKGDSHDEIKHWCDEHFKSAYKDWFWFPGGRYDDHSNLHIKDEKDNTMFLLMWGDKL